jgi:hypothetical protein
MRWQTHWSNRSVSGEAMSFEITKLVDSHLENDIISIFLIIITLYHQQHYHYQQQHHHHQQHQRGVVHGVNVTFFAFAFPDEFCAEQTPSTRADTPPRGCASSLP